MKKTTSILILSLFIYNAFGFLAIYPILSGYYKFLGMQRVEKFSKDELIEKLIFSKEDILDKKIKFQWIHSREFKYNGNLYDIVEKMETEDELIVYCINDTKEKKLEEDFEKRIQKNSLEDKQIPTINIIKFILISEPVQLEKFTNLPVQESTFSFWLSGFYQSLNLDIPSPPPRIV